MFEFAWPWIFLLAPLPWLLRALLPAADSGEAALAPKARMASSSTSRETAPLCRPVRVSPSTVTPSPVMTRPCALAV